MRVVIVGGGILGLATARLIARERADADVVVLEKEDAVGRHQTGRNSGVVHAGLYYAPGSLKARLCRRGVELLRAFCSEHDVPYEACGKLVVALDERQLPRLDALEQRAAANGVPQLARLGAAGLREIEPHVTGIAALHSPQTAITDFARVAATLAGEVAATGGEVRCGVEVVRVRGGMRRGASLRTGEDGRAAGSGRGAASVVELAGGGELRADRTIVCAGLHADRLAQRSGEPAEPRIVPFRGEYWQLRPERSWLVKGLIYPVPDPALPFLGIHLTRRVDGSVLIGPNAVLALAREGYRHTTLNVRDVAETLSWPGTARLMRRHWRAGIDEIAHTASKATFIREARRYVPELRSGDAVRAQSGVRAQAVDRDGTLVDDFRLGGDAHTVWVRNAPSPAATSSLAIAEEIVSRLAL